MGGRCVRNSFWLVLLIAVVFWNPNAEAAREYRSVSREKFNKVVKILLNTVKRTKQLEEQVITMQDRLRKAQGMGVSQRQSPGFEVPSEDDSAVDLSALNADGGASSSATDHAGGLHFNLYFDFWIRSQPGSSTAQGSGFTFDNIHNFFLVEVSPTPDIQFSAEIQPSPRYYELDYQITRWMQIRLGKIWIPFDQMAPHNMFGGRINATDLRVNNNAVAFLPDIWADLGIGFKFNLWERENLTIISHFYVVNGFDQNGTDPLNQVAIYPDFTENSVRVDDNNRAKSFGGRLHSLIYRTVGVGLSIYHGRYSDNDQDPLAVTLYGFDTQLYLNRWEFRFGFTNGEVKLPVSALGGDGYNRPAYYAEGSVKLGEKRHWKLMASYGGVNNDNRVTDVNDMTIVGGKILYRPNNIEWGLQYSRDIKELAAKGNKSLFALRVVAQF